MKKILSYIIGGGIAVIGIGYVVMTFLENMPTVISTGYYAVLWDPQLFLSPLTWIFGIVVVTLFILLRLLFADDTKQKQKAFLQGSNKDIVDSSLENSRFMTEKERDFNFSPQKFTKLENEKKDGIPVYAVYNTKKKELDINLASPMHGLIIGATGSGKTTTFVNPMIQILAASSAGSSMICTDPKGELFQLHSDTLSKRGYQTMVLDLRDPYSSFRWNPLGDIYDRYQLYLNTGNEIYQRTDSPQESGLELVNSLEQYEEVWYEYEGKAYAVRKELLSIIKIARQKIYDELYEDLNDLISVICPIESSDDPVWEKEHVPLFLLCVLLCLRTVKIPLLK